MKRQVGGFDDVKETNVLDKIPDDISNISPMMKQYAEIKRKYNDCVLLFRLGDFYEMFFEDAVKISKALDIALTARDCGLGQKAAMCGVPYHAFDNYMLKLAGKGFRLAICEQVEDPKSAKGIVKREVVRVITPGTITNDVLLDKDKNNFLCCIYKDLKGVGIVAADVTTGELSALEFDHDEDYKNKLISELGKYSPSEIVINGQLYKDNEIKELLRSRFGSYIEHYYDWSFDKVAAQKKVAAHFKDEGAALQKTVYALRAVGALLEYLDETQKISLLHINKINLYSVDHYMNIDIFTRRNLEITETLREKSKRGSLLWVLDNTKTSMGARLLRQMLERPLTNPIQINKRLTAVKELVDTGTFLVELREQLKDVVDLERLVGKLIYGSANCRDLIALKQSIVKFPLIKELLSRCTSSLLGKQYSELDTLEDIYSMIDSAIIDEPPVSVRDGGFIKDGCDETVDRLKEAIEQGKNWLSAFEGKERAEVGIKNLKVGFNNATGYYIEVTKSNLSLVPEHYHRKQTLSNCERYTTTELKKIENEILGASDKIIERELTIFSQIKDYISEQMLIIQKSAKAIAIVDVLCSLAEVASRSNYCLPRVDTSSVIKIEGGRHPIVEKMLGDNMFIPNDTVLDTDDNRMSVITGPNMAGKSTYMRQVALITLMAQIGSFVPARSALIGVVDKIFTRVGASDDLASGQSTFMVEMNETANILKNATANSLLIFDEIGRGTSTYDGLSIAWAVIEYVWNKKKLGAKTLFATHYHELTELEQKLDGVNNYCIAAKKRGDDIIFLRKIIRGGADDSYGIEVAKLAGVPNEIITRAKQILAQIEQNDINRAANVSVGKKKQQPPPQDQIALVNPLCDEIIEFLKKIDVTTLTPIEAMTKLYELGQKAKNI